MTPFTVTIEISEAKQCLQMLTQLLHIYPSLRLTVESNERTPIAPCSAQAYYADAAVCRILDAIRCISASYHAQVGADSPVVGAGAKTAEYAESPEAGHPKSPYEAFLSRAVARLEAESKSHT